MLGARPESPNKNASTHGPFLECLGFLARPYMTDDQIESVSEALMGLAATPRLEYRGNLAGL
jgi:hypothetical protein